jgi:hypothetical protein
MATNPSSNTINVNTHYDQTNNQINPLQCTNVTLLITIPHLSVQYATSMFLHSYFSKKRTTSHLHHTPIKHTKPNTYLLLPTQTSKIYSYLYAPLTQLDITHKRTLLASYFISHYTLRNPHRQYYHPLIPYPYHQL